MINVKDNNEVFTIIIDRKRLLRSFLVLLLFAVLSQFIFLLQAAATNLSTTSDIELSALAPHYGDNNSTVSSSWIIGGDESKVFSIDISDSSTISSPSILGIGSSNSNKTRTSERNSRSSGNDPDLKNHDGIKKNSRHTPNSSYKSAYAFLMAGCNPEDRDGISYRGYIYNILVANHILKIFGSTSDVLILVRMSKNSKLDRLPHHEEALFKNESIIIKYLPKVQSDTFYTAMLDKFQILNMVEYDRVLFFDSDVIPYCNLDYIFEQSVMPGGVLKENLVLAWKKEPSQGGFFMLKPGVGKYDHLLRIIKEHEQRTPDGEWDENIGWGHRIVPPDHWVSFKKNSTTWNQDDFYGAFADQGLLYHWVKYVEGDVTILIKSFVENWKKVGFDNITQEAIIEKESTRNKALHGISCYKLEDFKLGGVGGRGFYWNYPLYRDFYHFRGKTKPWIEREVHKQINPKQGNSTTVADSIEFNRNIFLSYRPEEIWYYYFGKINEKYNLKYDVTKQLSFTGPSLGLWPDEEQVKDKLKNGTLYEPPKGLKRVPRREWNFNSNLRKRVPQQYEERPYLSDKPKSPRLIMEEEEANLKAEKDAMKLKEEEEARVAAAKEAVRKAEEEE